MKKVVFLLMILSLEVVVIAEEGSWVPPVGIPMPSFGIVETYRMYDSENNQNPDLNYYPSDFGGYYTHYIDSSSPGSTNTNNPFGTKEKPRNTIPDPIPAGSIVEVHSVSDVSFYHMAINGTEQYPVFIRGVGNPTMNNSLGIGDGQYIIIEGFLFNDCGVSVRYISDTPATHNHHIAVRNNEVRGPGILGHMGARVAMSGTIDVPCDNIVVYNNEIHHWGDCSSNTEESGNDGGGVNVGSYTKNVWILDNHIHHGGGDSILLCHGSNLTSSHIFIGGNIMHDDRENAIDIKDCTDVIISQNDMFGYEPTSSSSGEVCVTHYGNSAPETRGAKRVWYLFNKVHDGRTGFNTTGDTDDIHYVGNVIYNTESFAFQQWSHGNIYMMLNTLYNVNGGIDDTLGSVKDCVIANNIFGKLTGNKHITLDYTDYRNNAIVENNLYAEAFIGNKEGIGSYIGDPLFVNPDNCDFNLQESSPVDSLETSDQVQLAFQKFYNLYGIDITCDIEGLPRVSGTIVVTPEEEDTSNTDNITDVPSTPPVEEESSSASDAPVTQEVISLPVVSTETDTNTGNVIEGLSRISPLDVDFGAESQKGNSESMKVRKIKVRRVLDKYESLYCARNNGKDQKETFE